MIDKDSGGFTLIELMIVVAIIGILAVVALPKFTELVTKSRQASTKSNLGVIRSALSIYFADNSDIYPSDDLACLVDKYIPKTPGSWTPPYHTESTTVENNDDLGMGAILATDNGQWKYWNWQTAGGREWGDVWVGCTHTDIKGAYWTSF